MTKTTQPTPHSDSELDEILCKLKTDAFDARQSCTLRGNWEDYNGKYDRFEERAKTALLQWADRRAEKLAVEARIDEIMLLDKELGMMSQMEWNPRGTLVGEMLGLGASKEEVEWAKQDNDRNAWVGIKVEGYKNKRIAALTATKESKS